MSQEVFDRYQHLWNEVRTASNEAVSKACEAAVKSPRTVYVFLARIARVNTFICTGGARLASTLGMSSDVFVDPTDSADVADREMNLASEVLSAIVDDYMDPHQRGRSHRVMAQATVEAAARYARLSPAERKLFAPLPEIYKRRVHELWSVYEGKLDNAEALVSALGCHLSNEERGGHESNIIDEFFRIHRRTEGLNAWLRRHPTVERDGEKLSAWYWVASHASNDKQGFEVDHFRHALAAVALARQYSAMSGSRFDELVAHGFHHFVKFMDGIYDLIRAECDALNEITSVVDLHEAIAVAR